MSTQSMADLSELYKQFWEKTTTRRDELMEEEDLAENAWDMQNMQCRWEVRLGFGRLLRPVLSKQKCIARDRERKLPEGPGVVVGPMG